MKKQKDLNDSMPNLYKKTRALMIFPDSRVVVLTGHGFILTFAITSKAKRMGIPVRAVSFEPEVEEVGYIDLKNLVGMTKTMLNSSDKAVFPLPNIEGGFTLNKKDFALLDIVLRENDDATLAEGVRKMGISVSK